VDVVQQWHAVRCSFGTHCSIHWTLRQREGSRPNRFLGGFQGKTNREIGDELELSEMTARNHLSNILSKLKLTSRAQAAAYAARHRMEDGL
jgi:FixJ family two-component response regulator